MSNKKHENTETSGKYKIFEGRTSQAQLSDKERSDIQSEIDKLHTGIQEYVNAYKLANPEKQTPDIQATTNNSNIISKSVNPTQHNLNKSVPTSRSLSILSNTQSTKSNNKKKHISRKYSRNNPKLIKH